MNNKKILVILLLVFLSILVGCTSNKFSSNYNQFKDTYIIATDFIEKDTNYLKALKKIDINNFEIELKKMSESMDNMNNEAKSKNEKGIYDNVKKYYKGLEYMLYAAKKPDNLTFDEKADLYTEVIILKTNRKDIKEGKL